MALREELLHLNDDAPSDDISLVVVCPVVLCSGEEPAVPSFMLSSGFQRKFILVPYLESD